MASILHKTRKQLGSLKWHLSEVWPAERRERKMPRLRAHCAELLKRLPALAAGGPAIDLEVHMLCGQATADMGVWASWSMMRFIPGAAFYLHSDGTLQEETIAAWKKLVPQVQLVTVEEAESRAARAYRGLSALSAWRRQTPVNRQATDYFLFGERRYLLSLDSDILSFSPPGAVIDAVKTERPAAYWMQDCLYAYSIPESTFRERFGSKAPMRVNGGFWLSPRFGREDWQWIDGELAAWRAEWREAYWSAQTIMGAAFSRVENQPLDPDLYTMNLGSHRSSYVVRHYPGPKFFRPRFFTEGIPAILKGLRH